MATAIGSRASSKLVERLMAPSGINASLAALTQGDSDTQLSESQIRSQNAAADLAERGETLLYPTANVYCEKIANLLTEKFRRFSGTLLLAVELRHSQDRLAGLQDTLELYADAVMHFLDGSRGDWGEGMYYAGGYQASFGAVKHGGKNYLQTAKVTFELEVSIS